MKIDEYAKEHGVHHTTVRRAIKAGEIQASKVGNRWEIAEPLALAKSSEPLTRLPSDIGEVRTADIWQNYPEQGLTPRGLFNILHNARQGTMWDLADLYDAMLERDPKLHSLLQIRKTQVLAKGWDILPNPGIEGKQKVNKAKAQADFIKEQLERLSDRQLIGAEAYRYLSFNALLSYLMDAIARGFQVARIEWETKGKWRPLYAEQIHQRHFIIGDSGQEAYNPYEVRMLTDKDQMHGEPLPEYLYITHYDFSKAGYLTRAGLLQPSAWYYLFKHHGVKWFLRYAELAATGFRKATYDPNSETKEQDIAALKTAMRDMGNAGYGIFPNTAGIDIIDMAKGSENIPSKQLLEFCDTALTELWLGQTATTKQTAGKLGMSGEQQDVQFDIMQSDAISLMDTVQRSLITPMALFNDNEVLCYFDIPYKPEEDQKSVVDMLKVVWDMGVPIPHEYIYERTGIPAPSQKDIDDGNVAQMQSSPFMFTKDGEKKKMNRNQRYARDARVRKAVYAIEDEAIADTLPLYDTLFSGVTESNYEDKLQANKDAFIKAYKPVAAKQLDKVRKIFDREYPEPVKNATLNIAWDLAEQSAADFFRWQAFSVATMEGELITAALVTGMKDGLQTAIDSGTTYRDFVKGLRESVGIDGVKKHHLQTVWRTNLSTAHSAAVYDKAQKGDYAAWEFIGIDDGRQTDICSERTGKVFPMSNTADWPPLHHQCRSEASLIDRTEMEEEGYEATGAPGAEPPAAGFKNLAVQNYNNWIQGAVKDLDPSVSAALKSELGKITG